MSNFFVCFVEFDGHKYDLTIPEISVKDSPKLEVIYPQIQQIIKLALNEDIRFESHDFQALDIEFVNESHQHKDLYRIDIKTMTDKITYKTTICIKPKQKIQKSKDNIDNHSQQKASTSPVNTYVKPINGKNCRNNSEKYHTKSQKSVQKIRQKPKYSAEEIMCLNSQQMDWFLRGKKSRNSVPILSTPRITKSTTPGVNRSHIPKIQKHSARHIPNRSRPEATFASFVPKMFDFETLLKVDSELRKSEIDVKDFYSIVISINIVWDRKSDHRNWEKVAQNVRLEGSCDQREPSINCSYKFFKWAQYYAQNYDSFDGKFEPMTQKIFDLLKIIHILDLNQIFSDNSPVGYKIWSISQTYRMKQYFHEYLKIEELKINNRGVDDINKTVANNTDSQSITSIQKQKKAISLSDYKKLKDIPNKSETNEITDQTVHNSIDFQSTNNSIGIKKKRVEQFIPKTVPSDPRLKRCLERSLNDYN